MITFVLHTCDKYEFCWKGSLHYLDKHFKVPMPRLFCNEAEDVDLPEGWRQFKTGKGEWSERLRAVLDYVTTPYVVYCQEDFWPFTDLSSEWFDRLLQYIKVAGHHALYICSLDFTYCRLSKPDTEELYRFEPDSN